MLDTLKLLNNYSAGYKIVIIPKTRLSNFTLSENLIITDKFRLEFQKWLDDFFGYTIGENNQCFIDKLTNTIFCSSKIYETLKNQGSF